jgi:putative transposase
MGRTDSEEQSVQVRLQAYRFELRPTENQSRQMCRFAGSARFVFNRALTLQKEFFDLCGAHVTYADLCAVLVDWKQDKETAWLNDAPSQTLQQSMKNLDAAWARRFDSLKKLKQGRISRSQLVGEPVFKKKGKHDSFRFPQGFKLDQANNRIFLPKLGWVRYRNSQEVLGTVKNVMVSLAGGRWFVAIQTERAVETPAHPSSTAVGIDMGVVRFATISDGTFYEPLNSFSRRQAALCRAQQAMSRKKKFSRNWKKAKARVARIHNRIANTRRDYLHKASTAISKNHAIVCIEDLQVGNMSRSAAGSIESPGANVGGKSGLNRSILDQGWAEFRRQLEYKLRWNGGRLIAVPPTNTSRTCPECGCVSKENRKTQASFCCVECGYKANADLVGAINVRRAGLARIACQVNDEASRQQQEPASIAA